MLPVPPINHSTSAPIQPAAPKIQPDSKQGANKSGSNLFESFLHHTNEQQVASDAAINDLVTGKTDNVQQVVMAVAKAEMSFQLFMEIRNKLIESYNELMRMQF